MIREFDKLNDHETELMFKAPFLVCILIAGADGTIDRKEIKGAINIAEKKHKKTGLMSPYFTELAQDFAFLVVTSNTTAATRTAPRMMYCSDMSVPSRFMPLVSDM